LVRKLWSENKAFSSYEWKGIIEDWWKEVDDLEWRLEEVKRQEAVDKFKKSGRTKISYEAKTFDDSDVIKEITIWLEGPLGVGTYWDFQKTLQEIGCPEEKIPKEDFMAKNSGRTLNIEW
jgi:hypothetical protein